MALVRGKGKSIIGLFVDGVDVKLAHLASKGKRVEILELRTGTLASKLDERKQSDFSSSAFGEEANAFDLPMDSLASGVSDESKEDNNAVILGLLGQYPAGKYSLTYSVSEPAIYYHIFDSNFGLKGKKLKARVLEELRNIRSFQPAPDAVDLIQTDENNLLTVVREDGLSLINLLDNIKGFIGNRMPPIANIDSADISLMNMVRLNYQFEPTEICVVVYIGVEFTRLIFMRGNNFFQFAPIISEGFDSPNLSNTVYSRLLLEQDNLAIQRIRKVVLAGECRRIGFKDFLSQQLPDQDIDYLVAPELDSSQLMLDDRDSISDFAIPIGAALRVLKPSKAKLYNINLLPDSVRENQRIFKLSWHGYLLLALIFFSTLFFTVQTLNVSREFSEKDEMLAMKNTQMAENTALLNSISELQTQIGRFETSLALYDSLVPGSDRWSKALTQISHSVEDLNSIWLTELASGAEGDLTMNGMSVFRPRIPRLSTLFDQSVLKEVNVQEIRKQPVYKYKIEVPALSAGR